MPWHVGSHESCPASKPHAVIKDADGSLAGCHATTSSANRQLAALYAQEGTMGTDVLGEPIALAVDQIDDDGLQWIEIMPTAEKARNGEWYFTIEPDDLEAYAKSIREGNGKIAVDWDHTTDRGGSSRAAGWFTGPAEVRDGEAGPTLWAQVRWSSSGRTDIEGGDYRFISPVFSFEEHDQKTGLMTKAKEILRATLTNKPFFTELAPVADLLDAEQLDFLTELYGEEVAQMIGATTTEEWTEARELVLGAVWTTAYVNDLPDSAFLYVEAGEKDSDGRTTPRSKRHFPVRDANGTVDMPHVRNALARIPQSNVPAAAKQAAIAKARRLLGSSEADDENDPPKPPPVLSTQEEDMELTKLAPIYGLAEDATEDEILAAARAAKEKADAASDLGVSGLKLEDIAELKAKAARGDDADKRLRGLEISMLLDGAVRDFKILPSQKDGYRAMAESDFDKVKAMIETTPVDALKLAAQGFDTPEKAIETKAVRAAEESFDSEHADGVDIDTARTHVRAEAILAEQGKQPGTYTSDEYRAAVEQAEREQ